MNKSNIKVNNFIQDISLVDEEKTQLITSIRKLILETQKDIEEDIKYGGLVFLVDGELISGLFLRKNHISLEFGNGSEMSDPGKLLEGAGKFRRHLKLRSKSDINDKTVSFFISQSFA